MINIINGTYKSPAGYYLLDQSGEPIGVALCTDCAIAAEQRENPFAELADCQDHEPIGYMHETDTPIHCEQCDALLVTTLTPSGVEYVREALTNHDGRTEILDAWREAFAEYGVTLAQELGVTVKVRAGFSGTWPSWARQAWTVTTIHNGRTLRFGYYGAGSSSTPTTEEIVEDMRTTARLGSLSFDEYAANTGADVDSIADHKTYQLTRKLAQRIIQWIGDDAETLIAE